MRIKNYSEGFFVLDEFGFEGGIEYDSKGSIQYE